MRLVSQSKEKHLDFRYPKSSLPLVVALVDSLYDTVWELIHGLVPDHPSIPPRAHLNGLKYTVHCRVIVGLSPCTQHIHVYVAQRFPFQPNPLADIPEFRLL